MRSGDLAFVAGALGFAAQAVAAPALHFGAIDLGTCSLSETTVYVTVPQAVTVTVHDTVTLSSLPASTSTRITTRYSSTTTYFAPSTETVSLSVASSTQSYEHTIYTTEMVTVTNFLSTGTSSAAGTLISSETTSSPYAFIVDNGTTFWLNGQTPPTSLSYVVATSVVTVIPVNTPPVSTPVAEQPQQPQTTTLTMMTTLYSTTSMTVLVSLSPSVNNTIAKATSSFGGNSSTTASGWAGWNTTSSAIGVFTTPLGIPITTKVSTFTPFSSVSLVTEESTFDIYASETTTYHLSRYTAHSGFTALPSSTATLSSSSTAVATSDSFLTSGSSFQVSQPSLTSSSNGEWTTAVINGQTFSWGGPGHAASPISAPSTTTFFANSTSSASAVTSAASIDTTCTDEQSTSRMSQVANATSVHPASTTFVVSTSTALGAATSITSVVSSPTVNLTTAPPKSPASSVNTTCTDVFVTSPLSVGSSISSLEISTIVASSILVSSTALGLVASSTPLTSTFVVNATASSSKSIDTTCTDFTTSIKSTASSTSHHLDSSTSTALGALTSLNLTSSSVGSLSTSTDSFGNISTFWTSSPIASLPPTSYPGSLTTTLSTDRSTSTLSIAGSSSNSARGTLSSINTRISTPSATQGQPTTFVTSTQSAVPSVCGICGDFTLNFDDIPPLSVFNSSDDTIDPEPVFSPYHKFDFSDGFVVVPPPTDPYLPSSPPLLTEFIPNFNLITSNPTSGPNSAQYGWSGDIGNADHGATGCFSFNVYGASFGCASTGPTCVFSFTGYKYSNTTGLPTSIASSTQSVSACPSQKDCHLSPVNLDPTFRDLDIIRINVTVAGQPKMWWMDDLRMGWTDNSCSTGLCRSMTKIRAVKHI